VPLPQRRRHRWDKFLRINALDDFDVSFPGEPMTTAACIQFCFERQSLIDFLPPVEIRRLADAARNVTFRAGDTIFRKGEDGDSVMLIDSGRVAISTTSADGRKIMLALMGRGEIFGEISVIDGGDRTADAEALEETCVVVIDKFIFVAFLERNPQVCMTLLRLMCGRLRVTDVTVEDIHIFNIRPRLAKRLLSLAEHFGEPGENGINMDLNVPPSQLAKMIGTSREAINSALRHWARKGVIDLAANRLTIRDRSALEAEIAQAFRAGGDA